MSGTNLLIRHAKEQDIPAIMELIYLKAEFDGSSESVEATPQKLELDLFGENPLAFVLLAEVDGKAIGLATYHFIYSTFLAKPGIWLDDLFHTPKRCVRPNPPLPRILMILQWLRRIVPGVGMVFDLVVGILDYCPKFLRVKAR